ncbi:MAG: glycosyltransferase family 4 protein [Bacteroidales bacterium]
MKIVNIVPGFGGSFYCGNCLRDSGYTKSLLKMGHQAMMLPIYLPLNFNHDVTDSDTPIFYGAVNIYLKQNFRIFKNMPHWLEKFFNSRAILKYAAKKAGSTRTDGLEEMTISMLNGSEGQQNIELQELIDFLKHHEKPDIVHLSNALLLGLAKEIRSQLNIPVICSLQDEDVWVDAMKDFYREKTWNLMAEKANDVDAFIAVSNYYASEMKLKMKIPDNKIIVVPIGIETDLYSYSEPVFNPPVLAYLSRLNHENGFEIFSDAFILLKKNDRFKNVKAKISGGYTSDDRFFIHKQISKFKKNGIFNDIEFVEDFDKESRSRFFENTTLLSVPVLKGEAFGTYQLESLACGTPLVQPNLGAFGEIAEKTLGGRTYSPNTAESLCKKWMELLSNPEGIKKMAMEGQKSVNQNYTNIGLSEKVLDVYQKAILNEI